MKEFKGIQGIWRFHDKRPHCDGFSILAGDQYIAFVGDSDSVTDCKTNAKLIAAAPELLDFALHVQSCILRNGKYAPLTTEMVDVVIKKALGE
jgi:hypothetical protein